MSPAASISPEEAYPTVAAASTIVTSDLLLHHDGGTFELQAIVDNQVAQAVTLDNVGNDWHVVCVVRIERNRATAAWCAGKAIVRSKKKLVPPNNGE